MAENKNTGVALSSDITDIANKLDGNVLAVIGNDSLIGFKKAYQIAMATKELRQLLDKKYMEPIMQLQGSRLGFLTDKDKDGGYPMEVVKNCLIDAVLMGVQPFGNQFNIIAGNCYVTKEGFGQLLSQVKGLKQEIVPGLPRINADKTSAAVLMKIKYTIDGDSKETEIDIPVKMNAYMGVDAALGKATRKARAWLYNTIKGTEISDGDAVDVTHEVVASKVENFNNKGVAVAAGVKSMIPPKEGKKVEDDPSRIPPEDIS